ncbi:MAG TPA: LacI family transcriptional regulator [Caldilineae bacterium]|nr:LacI family transcriptional regulator [Caldilineae bacterium]
MPVTMRDVARRAGVSIKTVSRVVNNQGEISEATRQRVLKAIEELGYRPNALARGLVSGKTLTVALIIPQITDPFFPEVVLGVESVARKHGYSVFLCNTNEDPQQELAYVEVLASKQVDGIILCGSRLNADQLSKVASLHRVSILTSRKPRSAAVVSIPGEAGLYEITSHLIRLGHKKIGHIGWWTEDESERLDGYRRALREHGIEGNERWVMRLPQVSIENAHRAARQLLERASEITAISCYNDLVAIGVLQACKELGRRVPVDLAVVGFDDIPLASLVTPALTTMRVPRYELGRMVMELLLRVIEADGDYEERLYVQPQLVIRESCGAQRDATSDSTIEGR